MSDEKRNIQMTPAMCTQCGASVEVDPKQEAAICEYCGTPFIISKGIDNYNIQNATVEHVDSINIVKTGAVESVLNFADKQITRKAEEKKRIEEEARIEREKHNASIKKYWWVFAVIIGVCFLMIFIGAGNESKDSTGKIRVNVASSDLVGENYEDVITDLKKAGFTNIETEVIDDLVTGWLTKDGEVEKVEIDGTTSFSSDSEFEAGTNIVVSYHTFPGQTTTTTAEDQKLVTDNNPTETTAKAPSTTDNAATAATTVNAAAAAVTTKVSTAATTANVATSATTAKTTTAATTASPTTAAITVTAGQKNAVSKAKSYLDYSAFSHDGLVEQLEYEKFTHEQAVYGADNCGANWNEQAFKQAKSYLDYSAFSHDGLVEQLEYEKFTHEQAVYGADNCGANWNEQAVKQAKSYLEYSSFSRDGLVEQLEYEKFTHEQAVYGADNCGATW